MRIRIPLATTLVSLLLAAPAAAAVPGVNVSRVNDYGDPYVANAGNMGDYAHDQGDTARTWQDLQASGARTVRTFVQWNQLLGATRAMTLNKYTQFADKARARGMQVELVVTGDPGSMATPSAYAGTVADLATTLAGKVAAYEVWNEEDDSVFWKGGAQPAAYAALLKAAYPAIKHADPATAVLVGGLVGNDDDFVRALYANGVKGYFDGIAVHTDTACLVGDPGGYYRELDGRVGRFTFTGYREIRATMLAHGDAKPIWMTELGWSTNQATCAVGASAGTKPTGVAPAVQAAYLTQAYSCLAADSYVQQALWFNLHDFDTAGGSELGLIDDSFSRKPAFAAFQRAGSAPPIACGGIPDHTPPVVHFAYPATGATYDRHLPFSVVADDDQLVKSINVSIDGVHLKYLKTSGTHATLTYVSGLADNVPYGRHTLLARVVDGAKNVTNATVVITRAKPQPVGTQLSLGVGRVRGGRASVSGQVVAPGAGAPVGTVKVVFERKQGKRFKRVGSVSRTARRTFRFAYRLRGHGTWRVSARYVPKAGSAFKPSAAKPRLVKS